MALIAGRVAGFSCTAIMRAPFRQERRLIMDTFTAQSISHEVPSAARRKVEEWVSGVKDQAVKLKTKSFEDLWGGAVDYIRDNPGKTILVSLGLGVVFGSLLRRRGR